MANRMDDTGINSDSKKKRSFLQKLKRYFFAGLAAIFPIAIVAYLVGFIIHLGYNHAGKYINILLLKYFSFRIPGLGLVLIIIAILFIGFVASRFFGKRLFSILERVFMKVPVIANIYPSAKQVSTFLFSAEKKQRYKKAAIIQYPHEESYALGFITNEDLPHISETMDKKMVSVFIPLAPLPFTGVLLLLPQGRVTPIEASVDQIIKYIVSAGIVPPFMQNDLDKEKGALQ